MSRATAFLPDMEILEEKSNEKPKKCIISAVDMWCKEKKYYDKVNYYVHDENKVTEMEKETSIRDLGKKIELESLGVVVDEAISSMDNCHNESSYIVFESCLFKIGGCYYSSHDTKAITDRIGKRGCYLGKNKNENEKENEEFRNCWYMMDKGSKSVRILDLKNIKGNWTNGPEMNWGRRDPHLLVLRGKLYVAGGFVDGYLNVEEGNIYIFMEVLENNTWKALPIHPVLYLSGGPPYKGYELSQVVVGAVEDKGFIITGINISKFDNSFYTYKPEEDTWKPYTNISFMIHAIWKQPAVVSGNLMICLLEEEGMLHVLDLEKNTKFFYDIVLDGLIPRECWVEPFLLMIEQGKFCLFYIKKYITYTHGEEDYSRLHSTVFTLKYNNNEATLSRPLLVVEKTRHISLVPHPFSEHRLHAICIADIEDPTVQLPCFTY